MIIDILSKLNNKQYHNHGQGIAGVTGFLLGCIFMLHICGLFYSYNNLYWQMTRWCLYIIFLSLYHFLEFFITSLYQPHRLSFSSFVIDHSTAYTIALFTSWIEYLIEIIFFPSIRYNNNNINNIMGGGIQQYIFFLGLFLVILGQSMRTIAMSTAKSNFAHEIQVTKSKEHTLVKTGVYYYFRHPSYFGWFWWSIGTQVLLGNPFCTIAYALAAWDFFRKRIPYEEESLIRFFPDEYPDYIKNSWIGIPFIYGRNDIKNKNT